MMNRRRFLAAAAWAPQGMFGLGRVEYRDYSRCLPDYLSRLAGEAYARRKRELAEVTTAAAVTARKEWARATFWRLIGGKLERTPLNAQVVGGFERDGYRVEKVIYESRPGVPVTANLYLPKGGRAPYPGVLFQAGHAVNGKAASLYQYCCQGLAQLGFVVLAFDPMGQGERTYYPRAGGVVTRLASADDEHTMPGKQMLLVGDTATRFQVWDAIRSLDYLAAHPMVDAGRLASTGNSGGGTLTMLLAAVDDRLACAAVASGNTENHACARFNAPGATDDAEQNLVDGATVGFDRWDTLHPFIGKPLLVLVSAKDWFGTYSPRYLENGREEFAELERLYGLAGAEGKLAWYESPLPHGLSYELRMEIYRWFRRWLQRETGQLREEPAVRAEPEEMLWCTKTGNVVRDLGSKTPQGLVREQARAIAAATGAVNWKEVLRLDAVGNPALEVRGVSEWRAVRVEAVEVATAREVWAPGWLYRRRGEEGARRWTVVVEPGGRNGRWNEEGVYAKLAAGGRTVLVADVRGVGDLSPEYPRQSARHAAWHQDEEAYAWASLMLGKPLLGQRVTDIRAMIRATGREVELVAAGKMTVAALIAAALEEAVVAVWLSEHLASYRLVVEEEEYRYPAANLVFNLLRHSDIPAMAAALAPRRVTIGGVVDGRGKPLAVEEARRWYRGAANVEVVAARVWAEMLG